MTALGIVDEAQKWIGKVSYVFGGDNIPGGQGDCSSYTQYVFKQNGIDIGRTTHDQVTKGTPVDKSQIQPGDLIFFQGTYNTSGASHVGIAIGNNQMIHLSSSNGVHVTDYTSDYWTQHYMTARRIDGSNPGSWTGSLTGVGGGSGGYYSGDLSFFQKIGVFLICLIIILAGVFFFAQAFGFSINPLK